MAWSLKDLQNAKVKGLKIEGLDIDKPFKKVKIEKVSVEKNTIEFFLKQFEQQGLIKNYVTELQFDEERKFRFDWAIPDLKIAIEYEGIFSKKSRHTTIEGFSTDCSKYNLAIANGWRVLRYTAMNYQNLETDLLKIL